MYQSDSCISQDGRFEVQKMEKLPIEIISKYYMTNRSDKQQRQGFYGYIKNVGQVNLYCHHNLESGSVYEFENFTFRSMRSVDNIKLWIILIKSGQHKKIQDMTVLNPQNPNEMHASLAKIIKSLRYLTTGDPDGHPFNSLKVSVEKAKQKKARGVGLSILAQIQSQGVIETGTNRTCWVSKLVSEMVALNGCIWDINTGYAEVDILNTITDGSIILLSGCTVEFGKIEKPRIDLARTDSIIYYDFAKEFLLLLQQGAYRNERIDAMETIWGNAFAAINEVYIWPVVKKESFNNFAEGEAKLEEESGDVSIFVEFPSTRICQATITVAKWQGKCSNCDKLSDGRVCCGIKKSNIYFNAPATMMIREGKETKEMEVRITGAGMKHIIKLFLIQRGSNHDEEWCHFDGIHDMLVKLVKSNIQEFQFDVDAVREVMQFTLEWAKGMDDITITFKMRPNGKHLIVKVTETKQKLLNKRKRIKQPNEAEPMHKRAKISSNIITG